MSTMNDPGNGLGPDGDRPRAGETATDRIAEKAHEGVDRAAAHTRDMEEDLRRGAADAADRARQAEQRLEASLEENLERVKAYVRKNPMASAGIAFVAGLVLSTLIRR
ncbi:MAG TPA: hypothetical protein VFV10_17650 [Gammaproteobacteria bacterium]|nr:hypothetical protein [Gammaproteobacteria bacterium]